MKKFKIMSILFLLMICGCSVGENQSVNSNSNKIISSTSSSDVIISTQATSSISSNSISTSIISLSSSTSSSSESIKQKVISVCLNISGDIKEEYSLGETLDFTNMMLNITYEDGTNEHININEDMVTLIDTSINKETNMDIPGYKMVVINYKGFEDSYLIQVVDNSSIDKVNPIIYFNFVNGDDFNLNEENRPNVKLYPNDLDYKIYFYSSKSGYYSTEYPTTYGIYSMIVEYEGDDLYNKIKQSQYFYLHADKLIPHINFDFISGADFAIGSTVRPSVKVSTDANYTITYISSNGYNSSEYPTVAGIYSMLVKVEEDDNYYSYSSSLWFQLINNEKLNANIIFNFKEGTIFSLSSGDVPSFTISEGAKYISYFSCDQLEKEGKQYKFNSFSELIPGYDYSLVVEVSENDMYQYRLSYCWFTLTE